MSVSEINFPLLNCYKVILLDENGYNYPEKLSKLIEKYI